MGLFLAPVLIRLPSPLRAKSCAQHSLRFRFLTDILASLKISSVAGKERKALEELARWRRFEDREKGFFPPKIAALYLGLTTQGLYAAADRGWLRFITIGENGSERFYSYSDLVTYRTASLNRANGAAVTPLERHLAKSGIRPHPRFSETSEPIVEAWKLFILENDGAFPPKLAAMYLKIGVQSVLTACKRGWIRSFLVGRENFYSRRDVVNYWHTASKMNALNRVVPPFLNDRNSGVDSSQSL